MWRAYTLKEAFRAIFAGDLDPDAVAELIDRWISRASRSRLPAFVKAAKTIRKYRDGILAAIRLGINNGRAEGLNNVVRLIFRRARGFHTAEAALALVMLTCGPITLQLPHERHHDRVRMTHTHAGRAPKPTCNTSSAPPHSTSSASMPGTTAYPSTAAQPATSPASTWPWLHKHQLTSRVAGTLLADAGQLGLDAGDRVVALLRRRGRLGRGCGR